jgi:hypothetical protein
LDHVFGRGQFEKLNDIYRVVELVAEWEPGQTRAYRLCEDVEAALDSRMDAFIRTRGAVTRVYRPDGKVLRKPRSWSARRNLRGLPAELVGKGTLTPLVPVDLEALTWLNDQIAAALRADAVTWVKTMSALGVDLATDMAYLRRVLRRVIHDSKTRPPATAISRTSTL